MAEEKIELDANEAAAAPSTPLLNAELGDVAMSPLNIGDRQRKLSDSGLVAAEAIDQLESQEGGLEGVHEKKRSVCCKLGGKSFYHGTVPADIMPYSCSYYKSNAKQLRSEVIAGITVAFAQVGESIAFAFIAGLGPLWGLHAAWLVGICTALFGSRPGMIFGATGVRAAVIAPFVKELGVGYVVWIVLLISVFQAFFAITKLANLVTLISKSVTIGFVNGLALIYAVGQVTIFEESPNSVRAGEFLPSETLGYMAIIVVLTSLSIVIFPRLHRAFPPAMTGLVVATLLEHLVFRTGFDIKTPLIGEVADVRGGLPYVFWNDPLLKDQLVSLDWEVFKKCIQPAFIAAAAGAVECVLCMEYVNDVTRTSNDRPSQQLWSLSLGNFLAGLFGTMGGGATIGVSVINCTNGANGRFRLSGVVAGLTVLLFVVVLSVVVKNIPTAALTGVMVVVVFQTFDWNSLKLVMTAFFPEKVRRKFGWYRKINRVDAITIVLVTVLTIVMDLFVAVVVGTVFTGMAHVHRSAQTVHVVSHKDERGRKIYHLKGPLFFASTNRFLTLFHPESDPLENEIHFESDSAAVFDFSGIQALNELGEKYSSFGKKLKLRYLNESSIRRLQKMDSMVMHFSYDNEDDANAEQATKGTEESAAQLKLEPPIKLHLTDKKNH